MSNQQVQEPAPFPGSVIRITNVSKQMIGIMINSINSSKANTSSNVPADKSGTYQMVAGSEIVIEVERISVNQLSRLRNLGQIAYK